MQASLALVEAEDDVQLLQSLAPGTSRRDWAAALLANGGLRGLVQASDARLSEHLSSAAIATLRASFEVTKRFRAGVDERPRLETPHAIAEFLMPQLAHLAHERFVVLCMNSRNVLLKQVTVADGSVDQCHVDPRMVFAAALQVEATGIVLAHNHPSGIRGNRSLGGAAGDHRGTRARKTLRLIATRVWPGSGSRRRARERLSTGHPDRQGDAPCLRRISPDDRRS